MNLIAELERLRDGWPHELSTFEHNPQWREHCHRCQLDARVQRAKADAPNQAIAELEQIIIGLRQELNSLHAAHVRPTADAPQEDTKIHGATRNDICDIMDYLLAAQKHAQSIFDRLPDADAPVNTCSEKDHHDQP